MTDPDNRHDRNNRRGRYAPGRNPRHHNHDDNHGDNSRDPGRNNSNDPDRDDTQEMRGRARGQADPRQAYRDQQEEHRQARRDEQASRRHTLRGNPWGHFRGWNARGYGHGHGHGRPQPGRGGETYEENKHHRDQHIWKLRVDGLAVPSPSDAPEAEGSQQPPDRNFRGQPHAPYPGYDNANPQQAPYLVQWPPREAPSPFVTPEQMEHMAWIAWRTQMLQMENLRRQRGRRGLEHWYGARGERMKLQSEAQAAAALWAQHQYAQQMALHGQRPPQAQPQPQPPPQQPQPPWPAQQPPWQPQQAQPSPQAQDPKHRWDMSNTPLIADARQHWFEQHPPAQDPQTWVAQSQEWQKKQRSLFMRIVVVFGSFLILIAGSVALLTILFAGLLGGSGGSAWLVWLVGIGIALGLPMLGAGIARIAFVNIARPLARVMSVADAVAGGDLDVRLPVPEKTDANDDFAQLSSTFNRMLDELQRTVEDRRNLTADVAHDLRTPLHIIQGNLEGILDGVYEPTREHITMLLEETHLLSRLIEDLRTLSLAESGYLQLHKEEVNIAELLADVTTSFGAQAEEIGVNLRVETSHFTTLAGRTGDDMPESDGVIEADAMRLNQVLANLVSNALRYTPKGGTIALIGEPIEGGVRIIVSDTGSGIAEDDLPYVFNRFWRSDVSRSHGEGAGGGLGLAIVKQLVELHGGQVRVQSAPGYGTQFTVDLPTHFVQPTLPTASEVAASL